MQKQDSAQAITFLEKEIAALERKRIAIHITGFREKLEPKVLLEHRESIINKHYEGVDYLKQKLLVELLPRQMPRLDQLPRFQDELYDMPQEFRELPSKSHLDQSYFLYQYALKTSWKFLSQLNSLFKALGIKVIGNLKTNLGRISQKIQAYEKEELEPKA